MRAQELHDRRRQVDHRDAVDGPGLDPRAAGDEKTTWSMIAAPRARVLATHHANRVGCRRGNWRAALPVDEEVG